MHHSVCAQFSPAAQGCWLQHVTSQSFIVARLSQSSSKPSSGKNTIINSTTMDNISETRTDVESIVAAPSHQAAPLMTSISQEPMFDGDGEHNGDDDLNVSTSLAIPYCRCTHIMCHVMLFHLLRPLKGYAERKVGFSLDEDDDNDLDSENSEKKQPLKLHRR